MANEIDIQTETIVETESFSAWRSVEPDGETVYHLDLGFVTVHFFMEEWQEFMALMHGLVEAQAD